LIASQLSQVSGTMGKVVRGIQVIEIGIPAPGYRGDHLAFLKTESRKFA
jgi:hypothetical protein